MVNGIEIKSERRAGLRSVKQKACFCGPAEDDAQRKGLFQNFSNSLLAGYAKGLVCSANQYRRTISILITTKTEHQQQLAPTLGKSRFPLEMGRYQNPLNGSLWLRGTIRVWEASYPRGSAQNAKRVLITNS